MLFVEPSLLSLLPIHPPFPSFSPGTLPPSIATFTGGAELVAKGIENTELMLKVAAARKQI